MLLVQPFPPCLLLPPIRKQFLFVPADVATVEDCTKLAAEADEKMEGIDGLVSLPTMKFRRSTISMMMVGEGSGPAPIPALIPARGL